MLQLVMELILNLIHCYDVLDHFCMLYFNPIKKSNCTLSTYSL